MKNTQRAERTLFLAAVFGASVILLSTFSGCTSAGQVHVSVLGKEGMNEGHAAQVFLYNLKIDSNFKLVPLADFWKDGESQLKGDLVEPSKSFMLSPGGQRWETLQVTKDSSFIGAAVDFRHPEETGWRLVYPIAPKRPKEIKLTVVGNRIELEKK